MDLPHARPMLYQFGYRFHVGPIWVTYMDLKWMLWVAYHHWATVAMVWLVFIYCNMHITV